MSVDVASDFTLEPVTLQDINRSLVEVIGAQSGLQVSTTTLGNDVSEFMTGISQKLHASTCRLLTIMRVMSDIEFWLAIGGVGTILLTMMTAPIGVVIQSFKALAQSTASAAIKLLIEGVIRMLGGLSALMKLTQPAFTAFVSGTRGSSQFGLKMLEGDISEYNAQNGMLGSAFRQQLDETRTLSEGERAVGSTANKATFSWSRASGSRV